MKFYVTVERTQSATITIDAPTRQIAEDSALTQDQLMLATFTTDGDSYKVAHSESDTEHRILTRAQLGTPGPEETTS